MTKLALAVAVMMTLATATLTTFVLAQPPPLPVPVATPRILGKEDKTDKKTDGKRPGRGDELLPSKFIRNVLESMPPNSAGYIPVTGLHVDTTRHCWLKRDQTFSKKSDRNIVLVTKDEGGLYHVVLETLEHQWEASDFDTSGWLPVKSVRDAGGGA